MRMEKLEKMENGGCIIAARDVQCGGVGLGNGGV